MQSNFGAERPLLIASERLKCLWLEDLPDSFGKNAIEHQQLHSLGLVGNQFENGIKRVSGPSKKSSRIPS